MVISDGTHFCSSSLILFLPLPELKNNCDLLFVSSDPELSIFLNTKQHQHDLELLAGRRLPTPSLKLGGCQKPTGETHHLRKSFLIFRKLIPATGDLWKCGETDEPESQNQTS